MIPRCNGKYLVPTSLPRSFARVQARAGNPIKSKNVKKLEGSLGGVPWGVPWGGGVVVVVVQVEICGGTEIYVILTFQSNKLFTYLT